MSSIYPTKRWNSDFVVYHDGMCYQLDQYSVYKLLSCISTVHIFCFLCIPSQPHWALYHHTPVVGLSHVYSTLPLKTTRGMLTCTYAMYLSVQLFPVNIFCVRSACYVDDACRNRSFITEPTPRSLSRFLHCLETNTLTLHSTLG